MTHLDDKPDEDTDETPFVPDESHQPIAPHPIEEVPVGESYLAIAGFLIALLGAALSWSILVMRISGSQWVAENLDSAISYNQLGVLVALVGAVLSFGAYFLPPRRLAIAGIVAGVLGVGAIQLPKSPEPSRPAPENRPREQDNSAKPKPNEASAESELWNLPDTHESRDEFRLWTTLEGKKTSGKFVRIEQGQVFVQLADGAETPFEFKQLVPRDQRWVKKQIVPEVAAPKPGPVPEETNVNREPYRNFSLKDGQVFAAKFIRVQGAVVSFEYEDGRPFQFPLSELSDADRQYVEKRR